MSNDITKEFGAEKVSIEKTTGSQTSKLKKLYKKTFRRMSAPKRIFLWYISFTIIGSLLLWAPFSQNIGMISPTTGEVISGISYIDALFMASSAFSDTGLSTVIIAEQFTFAGQFILFLLILIGGIGWFTIKIFILSFVIRKVLSWRSRKTLSSESGASMDVAIGTAVTAAVITISAVVIFGLTMGVMFYFIEPTNATAYNMSVDIHGNWGTSIWTGFFMANSAINNAGMDVIGPASMAPYYFEHGFQWIMMFLFVLGGMGFGIIYDVKEYFRNKYRGKKFKFSLLTKVSTLSYLVVSLSGLTLAYAFEVAQYFSNGTKSFLGAEYNESWDLIYDDNITAIEQTYVNTFGINPYTAVDYGTMSDRVMAITFNTMSTRNAGFSTIDLNVLSIGTLITYDMMMFVGSGPGSTAGGIRTTTAFVIVVAMYQSIRGRSEVTVFSRTIPRSTVRRSYTLFITSIVLVAITSMMILAMETGNYVHTDWNYYERFNIWIPGKESITFNDSLFLVFSAYGTTGLSTISLASLATGSKITLILLMFIGQLGALNLLDMFKKNETKQSSTTEYKVITENIPIG